MTFHHLSALQLDALLMNALPAGEDAQAKEHLAGCPQCRSECEIALAARDHFQQFVLPRTLDAIQGRAQRPWWRQVFTPWTLAPAMAVTAAWVLLVYMPHPPQSSTSNLGLKGTAAMQIFANHNGQVFPVRDGATLSAGDQIRFVVTPAGMPYLLVASVDGTGKPAIYFPYQGSQSGRLEDTARMELAGSIVLDAAPGPERVFAIFSKDPIFAAHVQEQLTALGARGPEAIRAAQHLQIPAQGQISVVFEKATP